VHSKWVWLFAILGVGAVLSATAFGLLPLFTKEAGWLIVGLSLGLSLAALAYPLFFFRNGAMRPASSAPVALPPVPVREQELTAELAAERGKLRDAEEHLAEITGRLSTAPAPQLPLRQQIRELKDEIAQLQIDVRRAEGGKLSDLQNAAEARQMGWGAQYEDLRSSAEQWEIVKAHKADRLKDARAELAELQQRLEAER